MTFEYRSNGRKLSERQFWQGIEDKAVEMALTHMEDKVHGMASSIIDPETGKHSDVVVRRTGETSFTIKTSGSKQFARELERRLSLSAGDVEVSPRQDIGSDPYVYLAHASEDKEGIAEPLANALMEAGIAVWYDNWEIGLGDSLRQKMEEGLGDCTHFVVLLTETAIQKPWVQAEIDVGFIKSVEKRSKFIPLRIGVDLDQLTEFIRSRNAIAFDPHDQTHIKRLVDHIFNISEKPALGSKPRYVETQPDGLEVWSKSAVAVAKYLVEVSKRGQLFDPMTDHEEVAKATGLHIDDVEIGVLDLTEAGLIKESRTKSGSDFWPLTDFFAEFDTYFLNFDNSKDAIPVANEIVSREEDIVDASDLKAAFKDWPVRRFNSALSVLANRRLIKPIITQGQGEFVMSSMMPTSRTKRFVRENI